MKTLLKMIVSAARAAHVLWPIALMVGLSGCAGMRSPGTADRSMVHASDTARDCRTTSEATFSSGAAPKLERVARAALGGVIGGLGGAVVGAGAALIWAGSLAPACVEPTTCVAGVGTVVTIGAVVGGVAGAVEGARTFWRESSGVARNSHACTTGPETRS